MIKTYLFSALCLVLFFVDASAQIAINSLVTEKDTLSSFEMKGYVLDSKSTSALPYANIYVLHSAIGVISNEAGRFSINISGFKDADTIRFQYIGYKTKNVILSQLKNSPTVYLDEDFINLSETLIFGSTPDAKQIVKKVIGNKDKNYKTSNTKLKAFIRERYISDIEKISLNLKKSSFPELNEKITRMIETAVPRHSTSYTDFLGNLYSSAIEDDSIRFKTDPIRTVSLKEKDMAELEQLETLFENLFKNADENEYWKVKSGIFSQKLDVDDENSDTIVKDTLADNERKLSYFNRGISDNMKYSNLDNKDDWEFLYKTGKYKYALAGGTSVNGEDVYIIDFEPDNSGLYVGKMYVSINTYALLRADYDYAPEKTGRDIDIFGIQYTENQYSGSIYFEKKDGTYKLKYFSKKQSSYAGIDRSVALVKKRTRFLFDKTLNEIKVGVDFAVISESSIEVLVLDEKEISHEQFNNFKQEENMDIIFVDQFDDNLWKGFSIIEPTEQMREYKKHSGDLYFEAINKPRHQ